MKSQKKNGKIRKNKAARLVMEVMNYVNENLGSNLQEKRVAGVFKVSKSTLRYAFKVQGMAYHQFVEEQRMQEARRLIEEERQLIKEAMHQTGYRNRSTFMNAFKKHFGNLPSSFQ